MPLALMGGEWGPATDSDLRGVQEEMCVPLGDASAVVLNEVSISLSQCVTSTRVFHLTHL